jgi:hypothetical protein
MLLYDAARGELDSRRGVLPYVVGDYSVAVAIQAVKWHKFDGHHASGPRPFEQEIEEEAGAA